jgi:hypothetical protein
VLDCGKAMWLAGHPEARSSLLEAAGLARSCGRDDLVVAAALAGDRGFFSVTAATDHERIELLTEAAPWPARTTCAPGPCWRRSWPPS